MSSRRKPGSRKARRKAGFFYGHPDDRAAIMLTTLQAERRMPHLDPTPNTQFEASCPRLHSNTTRPAPSFTAAVHAERIAWTAMPTLRSCSGVRTSSACARPWPWPTSHTTYCWKQASISRHCRSGWTNGNTPRLIPILPCFGISPLKEYGCESRRFDGQGHASGRIGTSAAGWPIRMARAIARTTPCLTQPAQLCCTPGSI